MYLLYVHHATTYHTWCSCHNRVYVKIQLHFVVYPGLAGCHNFFKIYLLRQVEVGSSTKTQRNFKFVSWDLECFKSWSQCESYNDARSHYAQHTWNIKDTTVYSGTSTPCEHLCELTSTFDEVRKPYNLPCQPTSQSKTTASTRSPSGWSASVWTVDHSKRMLLMGKCCVTWRRKNCQVIWAFLVFKVRYQSYIYS